MKCACKGDFLDRFIQPSILLLLSTESMHGFSIYKRLQDSDIMDYSGIDPTGLYRTLKKMEDAGQTPIVITSPIVRMYYKKLTNDYFKNLIVISYNEIESDVELQSVGMVTIDDH